MTLIILNVELTGYYGNFNRFLHNITFQDKVIRIGYSDKQKSGKLLLILNPFRLNKAYLCSGIFVCVNDCLVLLIIVMFPWNFIF